MLMQILGSFAEFQRSMIRERRRAGLDAARLFGVHPARWRTRWCRSDTYV